MRCQWQLTQLHRASLPASAPLQKQAQTIAAQLGYKGTLRLRVSPAANSPFAAGVLRPNICLPPACSENLAAEEITALLAHEIAHLRRHDMAWNNGWRWCQALLWFHPLVWKIPAAHAFACEQEADRQAGNQFVNASDYPPLLARLTLRILRQPVPELPLSMNGSAQISRRLAALEKGHLGPWTWGRSLASAGATGLLGLLIIGIGFSPASRAQNTTAPVPPHTNPTIRVSNDLQKPSSTVQFTGTVRYADGTPAPNVKVEIHPGEHMNAYYYAEAQTDADGHFQLYTTRHEDNGWFGHATFENTFVAHDLKKQLGAAKCVHSDERQVDLVLREPIMLTGSCVDPQNKPIPGSEVQVWYYGTRHETNSLPPYSGKADVNGQFVIPNLAPDGKYFLVIITKGYGKDFLFLNQGAESRKNVTLSPVVLYPKSHQVAGQVLDANGQPAPNVPVRLHGSHDWDYPETITDSHGRFRFDAICEGKLFLSVNTQRTNLSQVLTYSANKEAFSDDMQIVLRLKQDYFPQPGQYESEHPVDWALGPAADILKH
jgi:5-hydroxyisourate hydrolase-like protein (transthyretin family)